MKRLVAGTLAVAAVVGGIWAAQTIAAQKSRIEATADTDKAVLDADESLRRALRGADKSPASALFDRRFTFTDRTGKTRARAQVLKDLVLKDLAAAASSDGERDVKVRRYGRVALVTGTAPGAAPSPDTFFVHVWVKRRSGWRALAYHDNPVVAEPPPAPSGSGGNPPATPCENPCKTVPYRAKTAAERDIITAFQAIENAVTGNDADAWVTHIAEEFVVYRSNGPPSAKAQRVEFIRKQKDAGAATRVGEIVAMNLWVFGDAAVMTANHVWSAGPRPPYRVTRLWVRRDGRWQMALSQQTTITP